MERRGRGDPEEHPKPFPRPSQSLIWLLSGRASSRAAGRRGACHVPAHGAGGRPPCPVRWRRLRGGWPLYYHSRTGVETWILLGTREVELREIAPQRPIAPSRRSPEISRTMLERWLDHLICLCSAGRLVSQTSKRELESRSNMAGRGQCPALKGRERVANACTAPTGTHSASL